MILNVRTRIRSDLNPPKQIRTRIRTDNIRTFYTPTRMPSALALFGYDYKPLMDGNKPKSHTNALIISSLFGTPLSLQSAKQREPRFSRTRLRRRLSQKRDPSSWPRPPPLRAPPLLAHPPTPLPALSLRAPALPRLPPDQRRPSLPWRRLSPDPRRPAPCLRSRAVAPAVHLTPAGSPASPFGSCNSAPGTRCSCSARSTPPIRVRMPTPLNALAFTVLDIDQSSLI